MSGRAVGRVEAARGGFAHVRLPFARVGDGVRICARDRSVHARIVALDGARALAAPFGALDGVAAGDRVDDDPHALRLPLGTPLLGRAVDAAGEPLDGHSAPRGRRVACDAPPPTPGERRPCTEILWTGVRAIDGPLAIARGARVGVVGEAGTGKSSLLDAVVRGARCDAVVVALIGERGREAERRIVHVDARTTVVCATSDRAAPERVRAAEVAFAHAAALRSRGLDVLLVVDSLARVASAARDVAVAAGEPLGRGGYPAGALALLARLLECAGATESGAVTLVASVLADGGDDPIVAAARAALDGHIVLSDRLARAGRFPAVDVVRSASRTLAVAGTREHVAAAAALRAAVAGLEDSREARALGLVPGDPFLARALAAEAQIDRFLAQGDEPSDSRATLTQLCRLADILT
ncbi:MAG TPA: flagellum-specific ATP synthase FliI [Candidatus Elarobacter sp.]|nr:flagellum-specific ATP synthase FliI [Candidatus Elarobacter sp.]